MVKLYAAGLAILAGFAVHIWFLHCESFGCIGKGILWFAWTCTYSAWLLFGLFLAVRNTGPETAQRWSKLLLAAQALTGLVLAGYWVFWRYG